MTKQTQNKDTVKMQRIAYQQPKLRFPEFEGEWSIKKLGKVCDVRDGTHDSPKYFEKGYPLITSKNLLSNGLMDFSNVNYISEQDYLQINKRSKVDIGDILFGMIGTIGNPVIVKNDGFAIKNVALIKEQDELKHTFLIHLLQSEYIANQFQKENAGGILKFIALGVIRKLDVFIPKPEEQQKIATFLSSLDARIEAENQKLEALKTHKKGLMQQLFPQHGNVKTQCIASQQPKLRFKGFEEEWEVKKLGEMYSFKVTNSFSREKLNYKEGEVKNIHYGDIHTKFSTQFYIEKELVPFINSSENIEKIKLDSYCKVSDMIFADASEDMADVGKSIEIVGLNKEKLVSGLHTLLARQKKNNLITGFGGYLFKSDIIRQQIQHESQGTKVLSISAGRLSNIQILFPKDKEEQQKIASCLSSLDEIITAQGEKIEKLQEHKKGLMQQLFPATEMP